MSLITPIASGEHGDPGPGPTIMAEKYDNIGSNSEI